MCSYTHDNDNAGKMGKFFNMIKPSVIIILSVRISHVYIYYLGNLKHCKLRCFSFKFFNTFVCIQEDCLRKKNFFKKIQFEDIVKQRKVQCKIRIWNSIPDVFV